MNLRNVLRISTITALSIALTSCRRGAAQAATLARLESDEERPGCRRCAAISREPIRPNRKSASGALFG